MGLTSEAYARQCRQLLPPGRLWRPDPDTWLGRVLLGIGDALARVDARADDLLHEWDPATAVETIADWERVLGLPEPGTTLSTVLRDRQLAAAAKYAARGGATPAYFVALALSLGFVATVTETVPHTWRMDVDLSQTVGGYTLREYVFRAGTGRAGDPLRIRYVTELEAAVRLAIPAHTVVLFSYV